MEINFVKWLQLRESEEPLPAGFDPFTTLQQQQGDMVYFGVHDLSKHYREMGQLPDISYEQIGPKVGQVVNADPVEQTITVATQQAPFHYGYHKIEDAKAKSNRKVDDQGRVLVTLPVTHLQDISHMVQGSNGGKIWLVVDGNTKYQQGLMKEIRRKEVERAHAGSAPQPQMQQPQLPQQPQMPEPAPMPEAPQQQMPEPTPEPATMMQQALYRMRNREVEPNLMAHYDPTISNDRYWKRHTDIKYYEYVKG